MPPELQNPADNGQSILSIDENEQYNSEEDSDFDINAPAEPDGDDDEVDASEREIDDRPRKRRRLTPSRGENDDADEYVIDGALDSGDEATIRKAKEKKEKKKSRRGKKATGDEDEEEDDFELDEDEGGGGGFVRTRAMKLKIQEERKPLAKIDGATIDVDALWAQMNAPDFETAPIIPEKENERSDRKDDTVMVDPGGQPSQVATSTAATGEETLSIKRTYKFAGEVITEEKVVAKNSAEARVYLSSLEESKGNKAAAEPEEGQIEIISLRRPLRRVSRFDPNPPDMYKRSWTNGAQTTTASNQKKDIVPSVTGPKLNTVMKSKLDWATYVDKEGIKDELDVHSRAKEGYMGRMDFLNRVEAKTEEERRNARLKGTG